MNDRCEDGIRYIPRFTPGDAAAVALFGAAGKGEVGDEVGRIDGDDALAFAGLKVLRTPASGALTVLPPPPPTTSA